MTQILGWLKNWNIKSWHRVTLQDLKGHLFGVYKHPDLGIFVDEEIIEESALRKIYNATFSCLNCSAEVEIDIPMGKTRRQVRSEWEGQNKLCTACGCCDWGI